MSDLSVSLEPSCTNETQSLVCLQTGVAVAARESVFQPVIPAIRAISAALSAQVFPLAPLKVADITGGLDDTSRGFYHVKIRFQPKMANIGGWMMYPWMI